MNKSVSSYEQAIEYLYGRINFEKTLTGHYSKRDFKLDRMRHFLDLAGNPQDRIPAVHVAGTKGKGSTCMMIASILSKAGYQTGLFSSPHLFSFEERFQVNQVVPSQKNVIDLLNQLLPIINKMDRMPGSMSPTFFEIATAMSWLHFEEKSVDIAVMEVGLGGRLDTTNICNPVVTAITNISRDHSEILGARLEEIAAEKAGIAKPFIPLVCGEILPAPMKSIERICGKNKSPIIKANVDFTVSEESNDNSKMTCINLLVSGKEWKELPVPLSGKHQIQNTSLAIAVIDQLTRKGWNISEAEVQQGLLTVKLPIRMEKVMESPTVFVDAAHNWESIRSLLQTVEQLPAKGKRILIFGSSQDKDIQGILRNLIPEFDSIIITKYSNSPRAVEVKDLRNIIQELSSIPVHACDNSSSAWHLARYIAEEEDLICVTGSFFIAAEIRQMIVEQPNENISNEPEQSIK